LSEKRKDFKKSLERALRSSNLRVRAEEGGKEPAVNIKI